MNILVVLRALRDPGGFTVNRKAQKIFVNRESFIINPSDRNALEAALVLAGPDDTLTAVACGGDPALDALRQARATGASRAIWVAEPDMATFDARATTTVLQRVVAHAGGTDLVLLGAEVLDADMAQVGPRLAAALDWPFVERAWQAKPWPDGGLVLVVAAANDYRLVGVDLPAVASVARDSNQPRFAPAARIITIYTAPEAVERVTLADLGLDPAQMAPATTVRGESFPPERTLGRMLGGDDAVREMAEALRRGQVPWQG
jgi:electron transfer flavoprotein beta subunit